MCIKNIKYVTPWWWEGVFLEPQVACQRPGSLRVRGITSWDYSLLDKAWICWSQLSGFGSQLTMLSYHFGLCLPHLLQLFLHPLVLLLCAPSCWCYCLLGMTHLFELSSTTVSGWLASRTSPTGPQPCCSHPLLVASPIRTWRPLIHVVHSPVHSPSLLCLSVYTITAFIRLSCYYVLFKLKSFIQSAAWVLSAVMDSSLCRSGA